MEPYGFQQECVDQVGVPEIVSRLIGDEMGLGKTLEGSLIDYKLRKSTYRRGGPKRKTLIVAPLSAHDTWQWHIRQVFPTAKISIIEQGPERKRRPFIQSLTGNYNYYICHYEALRLKDVAAGLRKTNWFHIMCDEVHRVKNRKAQQTRGLKALKPIFKTGLSGTPADNAPDDLWSILNWLYPKKYTSYWRHVHDYCEETEVEGKDGATFKKVVGPNRETVPHMLAEMSPWYVRRLKENVLKDLPEKYYTDRWVELSPTQRKFYNQMRKDMLAWIGEHEDTPLTAGIVVAQLVRLQQFALATPLIEYKYVTTRRARQIALEKGEEPVPEQRMVVTLIEPSTKLDALEEIISDNPTEQLIVFSQSKHMVNLVAKRMARKGIPTGLYTGEIRDRATRDATVAAFQRGDLRIFAGTIAAGAETITLTASSTVVFLDRHWSPTKNKQAEDRAHRIGQRSAVQVIDIMARDTVDLGRRQQVATKWDNLRYLLGDTVEPEVYARALAALSLRQSESSVDAAVTEALKMFGGE